MKKITRQTLANDVAERWHRQYPGDTGYDIDGARSGIGGQLVKLGSNPNPDDVERIVRNTSWTTITCGECGEKKPDVIMELGEEPDYESSTAYICVDCLKKALKLATED